MILMGSVQTGQDRTCVCVCVHVHVWLDIGLYGVIAHKLLSVSLLEYLHLVAI